MRPNLRIAFLISLSATIGWILYMGSQTRPLNSAAIVQFEFAKTPRRAQHILDSLDAAYRTHTPHTAATLLRRSIHLDYAFTFLYPLSIALACLLIGRATRTRSYQRWAYAFACIVTLAGFADIIENHHLMQFLNGTLTNTHTRTAFYAAAIKFLLLALTGGFLLLCCIPIIVRWIYKSLR